MSALGICIMFFSAFIVFAVLHMASKNKKPFRRAFISMLCGLLTLLVVNVTSVFTGISLPISLLSVSVSVIGGIPGVTLLLALNMVL